MSVDNWQSFLKQEIFHEIALSIVNVHASLKEKHLRASHATFVTKEFQKRNFEEIKA